MIKVGITGAGLMGRLLAYYLQKKGCHVTLFDKDCTGKMSAAYAAAGMLSPISELEVADAIVFELGRYGLIRWFGLLGALGHDELFKKEGTVLIAHPQDRAETDRFKQQIARKLSFGFTKTLSKSELANLEPELDFQEAEYLSDEGYVDSRGVLAALGETIQASGARWIRASVESVSPRRIIADKMAYHFDWVFDCRGSGAKDLFSDLRPVRGELIYLQAPDVRFNRPIRLLHPRYRLYIVPRPNQHYLIGASEIEANDLSPISVRTCLELLSAAYSVHRGFAEARLIETIVALRPALSNNLPRILFSDGLIAVNGLHRHGFLLAPTLVDEIIRLFESGITSSEYPSLVERCGG